MVRSDSGPIFPLSQTSQESTMCLDGPISIDISILENGVFNTDAVFTLNPTYLIFYIIYEKTLKCSHFHWEYNALWWCMFCPIRNTSQCFAAGGKMELCSLLLWQALFFLLRGWVGVIWMQSVLSHLLNAFAIRIKCTHIIDCQAKWASSALCEIHDSIACKASVNVTMHSSCGPKF